MSKEASTHTGADASAPHGAEAEHHEVKPSEVFTHLMGELGDHHGLYIFNVKVLDLPIILYDAQTGLSVYASKKAMLADGKYTTHKGHPVKPDGSKPALDLSVTNFVAFQWIGMILIGFAFLSAARKYRGPKIAPKGVQNVLESVIGFLKSDLRQNFQSEITFRKLEPFFYLMFFFILTMNLIGLVPGGHTATSAIEVTSALALIAFFVINITAFKTAGAKHYFHHFFGGAPVFMAPIMVPIEIISTFIKPIALAIRLFANMTAGHTVLVMLVGLIFFFPSMLPAGAVLGMVAPVSVLFSVFIYCLELLVVFLQAYIFTLLTAVFTGLAIGDHDSNVEHAHHH